MTKTQMLALEPLSAQLPTIAEMADLDADQQMQEITRSRQMSTAQQVWCGMALAQLKCTVKHGEWLPLLETHKWQPRAAQKYIKFAEFAKEVAATNVNALSHLDMTGWLTVQQSLDRDALTSFLSGDEVCGLTLETAQEKSSRELKLAFDDYKKSHNEEIRALREKLANAAVEIDTREYENQALQQQLLQRTDRAPFPDFVMSTRHEAAALSEKALLCLDDLTRLNDELARTATTADATDVNIALTALYTHVTATLARTQKLANEMRDRWGPVLTDALQNSPVLYSGDELAEFEQVRELLIRDHQREARHRDNKRESAKPRGRGRPRKQ